MAKKVLGVGKTKLYIGSVTDTFDVSTLAADTWVVVDGVRNIPEFGDSYQLISVDEVNDGRTRKGKGVANAGSMQIVCSRRRADPGQIKVAEASRSEDAYNIKVEIPQGGGKFETNYITALVMGRQKGLGGPNDSQTFMFTLELTEEPLEVAPV